jgi:serine/threonine protein kinase/Tol biopolymer transport system component
VTPERWQRLKALFHSIAERSPGDRVGLLTDRCVEDPEMRAQLESLLRHDEVDSSFLPSRPCAVRNPKLLSGQYVGPYRVTELLGSGGMGEVYKATDTRLGRAVALKLLSAVRSSPNDAERLLREARTASALKHPNICTIYDVGEHEGEPFIVMELLEGSSLQDMLSTGRLSLRALLDIGIQIAESLAAAHAAGIVHRDIKPANIFVGPGGRAKILDFGIAQLTEGALCADEPNRAAIATVSRTLPGFIAGTPAYMSPEQIQGVRVDRRTDLYSLGLVLFEMATGCPPPSQRTQQRLAVPTGSRAGGKRTAKIPQGLARIIERATKIDPGERQQSAGELIADLQRESRRLARRPLYAASVLLLIATGASGLVWLRRGDPDTLPRREWEQITNFADSAVEPALSPDGRSVAFLRAPRTFTSVGALYVMDLRDRIPRQMTSDDRMKMAPAFTPDGLNIAYTRIDENWSWDTWIIPVQGGEPKLLLRNASGLSWLGPREVLFSQIKRGIHMGIVSSRLEASNVHDVYLPQEDRGMAHRSYLSPDGKWVLLAEMDAGRWQPCRVVPRDGKSPGWQAGPSHASCTSGAWSPDGRWIYLTTNAGGAFHIWRQRFPKGTLQQVTFGASEEEGIAMAADGKSLITSVGAGTSSVWVHDRQGDLRISEEGNSFSPQIFADGHSVYYLAGQRLRAFMAQSGDLTMLDLRSGERRTLVNGQVISFTVDTQRNELAWIEDGESGPSLWAAPLGRVSEARKLAANAVPPIGTCGGEVIFGAREAGMIFPTLIGFNGANLRKALPHPIVTIRAVSPDCNWLVVEDRAPIGNVQSPTVIYRMQGSTESRFPLCASCFPAWVHGGRFFAVRFGGISDAEQRKNYLLPVPPGQLLPPLFRQGRLVSEDEVARAREVRTFPGSGLFFGRDLNEYVYVTLSTHRNLFRVPLM